MAVCSCEKRKHPPPPRMSAEDEDCKENPKKLKNCSNSEPNSSQNQAQNQLAVIEIPIENLQFQEGILDRWHQAREAADSIEDVDRLGLEIAEEIAENSDLRQRYFSANENLANHLRRTGDRSLIQLAAHLDKVLRLLQAGDCGDAFVIGCQLMIDTWSMIYTKLSEFMQNANHRGQQMIEQAIGPLPTGPPMPRASPNSNWKYWLGVGGVLIGLVLIMSGMGKIGAETLGKGAAWMAGGAVTAIGGAILAAEHS